MIRHLGTARLAPVERFALELLVDLSRLLPLDDAAANVVAVEIAERATTVELRDLAGRGWDLEIADGRVRVPRAVLVAVGEAAGAVREQRSVAADRHGRVPSTENALHAQGAARDPLVSRAAIALRHAVVEAAGRRPVALLRPWPHGRRWAASLSHDLDVVEWWPVFAALRLGELARKGRWQIAARVAAALPDALLANPVSAAVARLLDAEARAGVRSSWYILCGSPTLATAWRGDLTYRPEAARTRRILADVVERGHEIGLHGSFATMTDDEAFRTERARLGALIGARADGVRQHYLRMRPGATQRCMERAGFAYDATFGFPDGNGFRLGVADVVRDWDDAGQRASSLERVPLVWMDRALSKYRGVEDPQAWVADGLQLARTSRDVEGLWTGLWHPNLTTSLGYPGAEAAYVALLAQLVAMEPWVAPIGDVVRWRRARRHVRALTLDAAGRPVLPGPEVGAPALELESTLGDTIAPAPR